MKTRAIILIALVAVVLSPLAGGWIQGLRPGFFDYPPLEIEPPVHAPFSWPVFVAWSMAASSSRNSAI